MAKAIVIDGNSLLFRAFYATYRGDDSLIMRTKEGFPTNAIFAFANMMNSIMKGLKEGDILFVAFDTGKKTFRHIEDESYKANRKPAPPLLIEQMPVVREFLKALNVNIYEKDGYEGDDIAGTFAKKAAKEGYDVIVYTSDRDYLQLIEDKVTIYLIKKGLSDIHVMNRDAMLAEYGFEPIQIIDYKGLRGDSSDNIPGIPGVGDKTATLLIQEHGTLENIIEAAKSMKSKVGENIVTYQDQGRHSYHLAVIDTDVELPFEVKDAVYEGYDFKTISEFANKYELKQFLNKLPSHLKLTKTTSDITYDVVTSFKGVELDKELGIALDIDEGNYHYACVYGLALCSKEKVYYISVDNFKNDEALKEILRNDEYKKYCYDFKAIKVALSHQGLEINGLKFDSLLAAYLLDSSLTNNMLSVMHYFNVDIVLESDSINLFDNSNPKKAAELAYFSKSIASKVFGELEKIGCLKLYNEVEIPLANILSDMEIEGIPLDKDMLLEMGKDFQAKVDERKRNIIALAGEEFNVDSPKQIADILFNKLGLPSNKKNSTSVEVLNELKDKHPIINEILMYRKYAKIMSTYVTSLVSHIHEDGKIHAMFNQALTATGRLSSSEPNLQNITVRDEEGKQIRKAFYYDDPNILILSLDYSQIELRILASLAGSTKLIETFEKGEDIHKRTARDVFHIDEPSALQRRKAKAVNFGIIYGISDWGLAEQIDVSLKEAKEIINNFYDAYPEIGEYFRNVIEQTKKNGYSTTLFGRRRYLREINDSNYQVREFARRAAMNAPIQGTAADLIKMAMIKTSDAIKEHELKTKMILQIHDELIFKVPVEEKEVAYNLIKDVMENSFDLNVKLEVDGGFGHSWYDTK